jgi:flavin reductase (DIM6/NTAB) family NADH-FMN oxidoreductase RutF
MDLDLQQYAPKQIYHLMTQTLVPRPIAWVLSLNEDKGYNLAPFSFFNGITSRPPLVVFSVGHKKDGSKKDTWVNIDKRERFVVNVPARSQVQAVDGTGEAFAAGESEVAHLGIRLQSMDQWDLPLVEGVPVAYLCRKEQILTLGDGPQGLIIGRLERIYVAEEFSSLVDDRLSFDVQKADMLARLGGSRYASLGDVFRATES